MSTYILLACLVALMAAVGPAVADWNVTDYGAVGDGVKDCTTAFQQALDDAGKAGGGVVHVPAGKFRIGGHLRIPAAVTLQGTYRVPPTAHGSKVENQNGTVLLAYEGRGSEDGEPFIRLNGSCAVLSGVIVMYPEWKQSDVPPVPYPPCVLSQDTENVGVIDCQFVNPYEAVKLVRAHRHQVRNVHGYPIKRGIYVDECYDIGHVDNVHLWPFGVIYRDEDPYCKWINTQGTAFEFARTDWEYVTNTFCFGYGAGYRFSESKHGAANGSFLAIGADSCQRAVVVEQCQPMGLLITNGEFVGRWGSRDSICLDIEKGVRGKVSLCNCAFWGPIDRCIWMRAPNGQISLSSSVLLNWNSSGKGSPAIQVDEGRAIIQGNTFGSGDTHIIIGSKVRSAIIASNQSDGGLKVLNRAGRKTQMLGNEANPVVWTDQARMHYRVLVGTQGDQDYLRNWSGRENTVDKKWKTMRWSTGDSDLILPVVPGKEYTVTIDVSVPAHALDPKAGLYLGPKRIAEVKKAGRYSIAAVVPPSKADTVTLKLRSAGWVPREKDPGSGDARTLGIMTYAVVVKAKGAGTKQFDANTGEWVGGAR